MRVRAGTRLSLMPTKLNECGNNQWADPVVNLVWEMGQRYPTCGGSIPYMVFRQVVNLRSRDTGRSQRHE